VRDNHSRARHANALRRKKPARPPYDRILVVCEGKKTEPNYFEEIRIEARISAIHVCVLPSGFGAQPSRVVEFAVSKTTNTSFNPCSAPNPNGPSGQTKNYGTCWDHRSAIFDMSSTKFL
jgi:hypothetical protein